MDLLDKLRAVERALRATFADGAAMPGRDRHRARARPVRGRRRTAGRR